MEYLILFASIFTTIVVLKKYAKNKTSNQVMLLGLEVTVGGVGFIAFGNYYSSNNGVIFGLIGLLIAIIGFTVSIFGFVNN
jgi:hypothetical protein